ncbi:hypothetical protein H7849_18070 [Alloacidobacterium dinghuense]|uniref:DUF5671 domain-containing protein n=1 Tax=Alloacidobacterium dinghuense TaxID=2763107 RepID=A0A7G8BEN2_9BACT|nr:DUF5671 domain-containing protein [Alloacidobacterium dinghuense]QNI31002.1 hypothetical protein H7849_18070 [Alloacidobacterium dinghuense]
MPDPRITEFIEKAIAAGIPQDSLVGMLTARGWPEKEVYDALADHYQQLTGVDIPRRAGAGASAKEAFFYLLIFSTLATWTIGFGCLAFALIDRWLADPLFSSYPAYDTYTIPSSLAALIVAFPLYLLISRIVVKESAAHPEKLDSSVRKWLTYMALVIAASVFMGDLITALAYLLRGELTSRFLAKSFVVLVLSGGVFYYYFGGLRKTEAPSIGLSRDRLMAGLSSAAVALMIVLGFLHLGPPNVQREFRADSQRIHQLYDLSTEIREYWTKHGSQLPTSIDQVPGRVHKDPLTRTPYEYHPKEGSQYELCAVFTRNSEPEVSPTPDPWIHPAGHHCFSLDAAATQQYPPQYFGN